MRKVIACRTRYFESVFTLACFISYCSEALNLINVCPNAILIKNPLKEEGILRFGVKFNHRFQAAVRETHASELLQLQAPPTAAGFRKPAPSSQQTAEDDLYSFEKKVDLPAPGDTGGYRTSGGRMIGTSSGVGAIPRTGTAFGFTSAGRMGTGIGVPSGDGEKNCVLNILEFIVGNKGPRPMTSVRAAGYSSRGRTTNTGKQSFDPFNQAATTEGKAEPLPEEQIKIAEKKINSIIQDSTIAASEGNFQLALERAKDAGKRERALAKQRDQAGLGDQINLDLTYCVLFNLANQYHGCKMYQEALNSYAVIVKNKMFNQSGRLRVNMGNIYFEQQKYSQAVKMYRMALDQIPNTNRDIRLKIMRNIGAAFVKMGQFQDAITSFESIMEISPDHHTGFNLILCYFALGDRERMKKGLQKLVAIRAPSIEQNDDITAGNTSTGSDPIDDHEVFNEDKLREIARERQKACERFIILAAKLVAPTIELNFSTGFDTIIETIKSSPYAEISSELEIAKAIQYLKSKDFSKAIDTLKSFEKKDPKLVGTASTNLSFLYFLEGDYRHAEKYARLALTTDKYNAKAQTNLGNCYFVKEEWNKAKECYQEAVGVDALCTEATYNLGLAHKKLDEFGEAYLCFEKLHAILRNSAEVIYQIADICDKRGYLQQAMEWYNILISVVPTDPGILARLGDMFVKDGDKSQAFQYYSESYRYFPSNMDVIAWLGAYYVDCEVYEHAIQFFERATLIQPNEIKWQLMIASCFRRSGNYQQAFETYKRINMRFPENIECLRFLVRICTDLGMKEAQEYVLKLAKAEKSRDGGVTGNPSDMRTYKRIVEDNGTKSDVRFSVDANMSRPKTASRKQPLEDEDWHNDVVELLPE
ncbi:Intraflagellar transport protein 88 [Physocladia obscura]|uniref:Intraflagellar transport protein 88 n=1 Tax=Physocladia obscura TaxID=109957 RepID=A0AAD5XF95_9FUNG|nr:Intraflagellar transport protein 88 [Physocladia obscura]